jgi:hypothetical protein
MSVGSWLTKPHHKDDAAQQRRDRQPRRQPTYARLSLEYLEERTLLDASSGLIGGATNNLSLNSNFNLGSNSIIAPIPTVSTGPATANGADASHSFNFSGLVPSGSNALAASSAFLAQSQPNSQFRLFAANSQGADYSLSQQTSANILFGVNGFGSGTQPNAPWRPNAYNLGLANRQFNYSSQADFGFQPVAPWTVPVAQAHPKEQLPDQNEEADRTPEQALVQKSVHEQEQTQKNWMDDDGGDNYMTWKALLEKSTWEKEHLADQARMPENQIPDAVWLSALAPTPMAALVAGLPGIAVAAENGDSGATECGDGGAGAPE